MNAVNDGDQVTVMADTEADQSASVSVSTRRYARQRAGLSLNAAAGRAGVSRSSLSAYERGVRTPSLDRLFSILESLGFAVRIELAPRVRERNGVPRGDELVTSISSSQWIEVGCARLVVDEVAHG